MSETTILNNYTTFVDTLTSDTSKSFDLYIKRLEDLQSKGCNISLLDTAISGLLAEAGESMEILKKMKFQGKEWNEDIRMHLKKEAGDAMFYWIDFCIALGFTPEDVIEENVNKLKARYPGGTFDVHYSENRKAGDI